MGLWAGFGRGGEDDGKGICSAPSSLAITDGSTETLPPTAPHPAILSMAVKGLSRS